MTMSTPVTLAIDTAQPRLALALVLADGSVTTDVIDIARGHAEIIMDHIGRLLADNAIAYADLERVATTTGPGSFTGLRIGLSVARGLGLARGIPVIGIPSLLALSLSHSGASEIIIDAKRGQAYRQSFSAPGRPHGAAELADLNVALQQAGRTDPDSPLADIGAIAIFAAKADPKTFPPDPAYIRDADAKPQTRGKVERQ